MSFGDVLECLAAICLILAAYFWLGVPLALLAAAASFFYLGQCYSALPPPWPFKRDKK